LSESIYVIITKSIKILIIRNGIYLTSTTDQIPTIMPADSTYLNTRATTKNSYDAIIVGSGISGGWAAKELCEKGLKVLLLKRADHWNILIIPLP
jgi:alkyl hydroperoxide reductase subunit AhpF